MIIFDLDGTLSDCEHRRYLVDASKRDDCYYHFPATLTQSEGWYYKNIYLTCNPPKPKKFIPDFETFHELCDQDKPIEPTLEILNRLMKDCEELEIWSGRPESVRDKTVKWLLRYTILKYPRHSSKCAIILKMRPNGDSTPDDQLKERWLNEQCADLMKAGIEERSSINHNIEYVFDDRPKVIRMWQRRGIFVFNCSQSNNEF